MPSVVRRLSLSVPSLLLFVSVDSSNPSGSQKSKSVFFVSLAHPPPFLKHAYLCCSVRVQVFHVKSTRRRVRDRPTGQDRAKRKSPRPGPADACPYRPCAFPARSLPLLACPGPLTSPQHNPFAQKTRSVLGSALTSAQKYGPGDFRIAKKPAIRKQN